MAGSTDWVAWHRDYEDPASDLSRRRRSVQSEVSRWLDDRDGSPLHVVSACSGDGRDLLDVLASRTDRARVAGRLLETDQRLAADARDRVAAEGLEGIEVAELDAGSLTSYDGAVPADLVMMCGVFGNVSDEDLHRTVLTLPRLCAPGATVIWTRGAFRSGDLTPVIRQWFTEAGFAEQRFDAPEDAIYRVGTHRLVEPPPSTRPLSTRPLSKRPLSSRPPAEARLFTFIR